MFLQGLDQMQSTLTQMVDIAAFEKAHWARQPWLRLVTASLSQPNRRGNEGRHSAPAGEEGARGE
ncbi:MAG: hypothetical protein JWL65_5488 [Gammaproteobacteria bacterium]|jgi:hypothetical protein|nr:hypothetical protein [Gammaproteobacteria bacterium]